MVDSTVGIGGIQNLQSGNRAQNSQSESKRESGEAERKSPLNPQDEVSISQEALSLSEAESAAARTRELLEGDQDATLGLDPSFTVNQEV